MRQCSLGMNNKLRCLYVASRSFSQCQESISVRIILVLKLQKRVAIMSSLMFLWHVEPICFTDFQKGRDIDKRWGWFKKGSWTPFSELCFFSFDLSTINVLSCRNQTSQLICKANQLTGFYMIEHWSLRG